MNYQELLESLGQQLKQLTDARASSVRRVEDFFKCNGLGARAPDCIWEMKKIHAQLAELGGAIAAVARAADSEGPTP